MQFSISSLVFLTSFIGYVTSKGTLEVGKLIKTFSSFDEAEEYLERKSEIKDNYEKLKGEVEVSIKNLMKGSAPADPKSVSMEN